MEKRGLRNNNPGNIRKSLEVYQGEIESIDKSFKQFESMAYGYRAILRILTTYIEKYSLDTVDKMIYRWAPPAENDTEAYIEFVCKSAGVDRKAKIQSKDEETMCRMVAGMSEMENGRKADMADVRAGWRLLNG